MILIHIMVAQLKMIARNRQALFWSIAFPLIFVVVFGVFYGAETESATLAVVDHADDAMSQSLINSLQGADYLELIQLADEAEARQMVFDGDIGFALVIPADFSERAATNPPAEAMLIYDDTRPFGSVVIGFIESAIGRANLELLAVRPSIALAPEPVSRQNFSRVDLVMPALAVWGVMSFSIMGLATALTTYREKRILLRIQATPLRVSYFFAAKVAAYLILALIQLTLLLSVAALAFGARLQGDFLHMAALMVFANLVFLSIGFIVAAHSKTVAAASGLGNVVALPLMFVSGVFFPTDILPTAVQFVVEFLPLSPALVAMRGVALESRPLWDFPVELATLACWLVATALIAVRTFKFR